MQKTLFLWLLSSVAARDLYLVTTRSKNGSVGKTKIAAVKTKPKPRGNISKNVKTGSNDYSDSDAGWIDAVGYDYNDQGESKKGAKSKKSKKSKKSMKKKDRCEPGVKVGRAVIAGGHYTPESSGRCRIHFECGGGEVCTRDGTCQNIPCTDDHQCKEKVALPSACKSAVPGVPKTCSSDAHCTDSEECLEAGKDFVCHKASGQCKPSYGACFNTCDCLNNFKMVRGEALCDQTHHSGTSKKVCLCRSEELADCRQPTEPIDPVKPEEPTDPVESVPEEPIHPVESEPEEPIDPVESEPSTSPAPVYDPPPKTVIDEVVTDPGIYAEPTTTKNSEPPVTVIEDVVTDPGESGPTTMQPPMDSCPLPRNNEPPGGPGSPCRAHTACFSRQGLVCAKQAGGQGKCEKLACKSDEECASKTSLPTRCSRGQCKERHCYENHECPRGYACDSGGHCKQDLGACKYDCDCSQCDAALCFKGHCICKAEHDECTVAPGQEDPNAGQEDPIAENSAEDVKDPQMEGGGEGNWEDVNQVEDSNELPTEHKLEVTMPAEQHSDPMGSRDDGKKYEEGKEDEEHKEFREEEFNSNTECLACDCPPGWQKTDAGCYKLFKDRAKDKVDRKTAQSMCEKEGGFIAEVTTKKEMVNLQLVFENKVIPVWLGAQRSKGGNFKWNSGVRFTEDQVDEEGKEGGCLIRKAQHKKVVSCEEKFYVLCEVDKIQPAS